MRPPGTSSTSRRARSTSRRTPRPMSRWSSCCLATAPIRSWSTSMAVPTAAATFRRPAEPGSLVGLAELLDEHGLRGVPEEPLEHDGWSGAGLTRLTRPDGARFVLKRDSLARDWLARSLDDRWLREAQLLLASPALP